MRCTLPLLLLMLTLALPACQGPASEGQRRDSYVTVPATVQRQTDRARALNEQALTHLERGELDEAQALLKEALIADVTFGPAHNNLGKVHFEQDQLYLAAWEFDYAIRLMPHHPEPRNNLGLVFERARKLDEAVEHYEAARKLQPDHPEILGNLLRARLERGDTGPQVQALLEELILKDDRSAWVEWAREKQALLN